MIVKEIDFNYFLEEYNNFYNIKKHTRKEYEKARAFYEYLKELENDTREPIKVDFTDFKYTYEIYHITETKKFIKHYAKYIPEIKELEKEIKDRKPTLDEIIDKVIDILVCLTDIRYFKEYNTIVFIRF